MRAQKTLVLLAITAISAITIFLILLLDAEAVDAALPAVPDSLECYVETVSVGPEGDAEVEVQFVLGRGGYYGLLLPFGFEGATDFAVNSGPAAFGPGDDDEPRSTVRALGVRMLNLRTLPGASAGDTVLVSARVDGWYSAEDSARPFGEFGLGRRFVNTSQYVLKSARLEIVLPDQFLVQDIDRATPGYDPKANPSPPYSIAHRGGRVAVSQTAEFVAPAEVVELYFGMRPARRGRLPLYLGLALAALHLVFYRDVLRPQD